MRSGWLWPAIAGAAVIAISAIAFTMSHSSKKHTADDTLDASPRSDRSVTSVPTANDAAPSTRTTTRRPASEVALPISAPITQPACDGSAIVVLGSAVRPGNYESEVQRLLDAHPGSSYLRTDHSCPSLRQQSDSGTPIYAM